MMEIWNWYWVVAGDATSVWSSKRAVSVPADDADYVAWLADGTHQPSHIGTMEELYQVLAQQYPRGSLHTYCAFVRDKTLNGGVTVNGLPFASDPLTFGSLNSAAIYTVDKTTDTFSWKLPDGSFITLNKADVNALHDALNSFGQACYLCEDNTLTAIEAGTVTTHDQIDAAFAAINSSFTGLTADAQKVRHKRK